MDDVDLAADHFDDDLDEKPRARALRRPAKATMFLGGLVLASVGFIGGVLVQRYVSPATASTPAGPAADANAGPVADASGWPPSGGATTGTVKLVDGTTLYLTTADGQVVTVKVSSDTALRLLQSTAVKDLAVGSTVTVQGTTGSDGAITATQVTAQR